MWTLRTETSKDTDLHTKTNPYTFNDFFIHGIKYITNLCKLITKSNQISCFSRCKESSIECTEQERRHQVKLKNEPRRRAVSCAGNELFRERWVMNVCWEVVTKMHIPHTENRTCPWGDRYIQDAGHHRCHQSVKLWARTWFQVSQKAVIGQENVGSSCKVCKILRLKC